MATERMINGRIPSLYNALHLLVFGSTLVIYNLPVIINSRNNARFYSTRGIFFFTGIAMCVASIAGLPVSVLEGSVILGFFSLGYSVPVLPFLNKRPLRKLGWLKTLDLTAVWTIATYVLPVLYWHRAILALPFEFLLRFVLIFALCVLFDIRDIRNDLKNNTLTLPHRIGLRNCYRLLYGATVLFVLLSVLQYLNIHTWWKLTGALLTAGALLWVIRYCRSHSSPRVYLGLVDGVMLFYAILALV